MQVMAYQSQGMGWCCMLASAVKPLIGFLINRQDRRPRRKRHRGRDVISRETRTGASCPKWLSIAQRTEDQERASSSMYLVLESWLLGIALLSRLPVILRIGTLTAPECLFCQQDGSSQPIICRVCLFTNLLFPFRFLRNNQQLRTATTLEMPLTGQQNKIISECPIHGTHDPFRDKLRNFNGGDKTRQTHIVDLLGALVLSPAALELSSPDGSGNVAVKLLALRQQVRENEVDLDPFDSLVRHVVDKYSDLAIWAAVFSLIDTFYPRTPPPSPASPRHSRERPSRPAGVDLPIARRATLLKANCPRR